MVTSRCDVAIVGGGPAGLAAAAAAAEAGCQVVLLDAGPRLGGQYWRHPVGGPARVADLHHDLGALQDLLAKVRRGIDHRDRAQVWSVDRDGDDFVVRFLRDGTEGQVRACAVVLATGAYDRQLPLPGWDLPGVMAAGGVQALLKGSEALAGRRIVVAGTGPFLLPVAVGVVRRGGSVAGVFEANSPVGWLPGLGAVARSAGKVREGLGYAATLARHRVPYRSRHAVIAVHGREAVEGVTVARVDRDWRAVRGSQRHISCDTVALGWGFTPQLDLALGLDLLTRVDVEGSLVVTVDEQQAASVPGVFVAGEATGVGGAALAVIEGRIAGAAAAGWLGRPPPRGYVRSRLERRRAALRAFAAAMHRAHPIRSGWRDWLTDETLLCRCEEVPVRAAREAVRDLGAIDARAVKLLTRAGMGWCQARVCGFATAALVAEEAGTAYDPRGLAARPIATPLPLGTLAQGVAGPAGGDPPGESPGSGRG